MAHGASHHAPPSHPGPRADTARARDCSECNGWGTVVTEEGRHELCAACQAPAGPGR